VTKIKRAPALLVAVITLLITGCGDSRYPMTEVAGKVMFSGGPPPKAGRIAFQLVPGSGSGELPYRPGTAAFGADGEFQVTTFEKGDGLMPGTYEVRIICIDGLPGQTKSFDDVSFVPPNWKPENLVVTGEEHSMNVDFDVPPKKSK
jgi:hypothetical protein